MPIYEYQCGACEHEFEALQPMTAEPIKKCPECGKSKVSKLISAPMIKVAPDGPDRYQRKEMEHGKKVKDKDRAMKNRRKAFGSENVNVSRSDLAKQNHTFQKKIVPKAQGQTGDIDREQFVKQAAKNPKALAAAKKVLGK